MSTVPEPYLTHEDVAQLIEWIDGIIDLARDVFAQQPSAKLSRMRASLIDARDRGGDVYLDADGPPPGTPSLTEAVEKARGGPAPTPIQGYA